MLRRYDGHVDEPESAPLAGPVCPWCSAALTSADQPTCPACGANLVGDPEAEIEGVTALDRDTRIRLDHVQRASTPPPRRGLMAWISAADDSEPTLDPETAALFSGASIEPPSADVRREMIRLEMEALRLEVGELTGEPADLAAAAISEAELPGDEVDPTGDEAEPTGA